MTHVAAGLATARGAATGWGDGAALSSFGSAAPSSSSLSSSRITLPPILPATRGAAWGRAALGGLRGADCAGEPDGPEPAATESEASECSLTATRFHPPGGVGPAGRRGVGAAIGSCSVPLSLAPPPSETRVLRLFGSELCSTAALSSPSWSPSDCAEASPAEASDSDASSERRFLLRGCRLRPCFLACFSGLPSPRSPRSPRSSSGSEGVTGVLGRRRCCSLSAASTCCTLTLLLVSRFSRSCSEASTNCTEPCCPSGRVCQEELEGIGGLACAYFMSWLSSVPRSPSRGLPSP
mmetsp:Transcript_18645/g.44270  ORF Transcript_18645/g.44270 Transcript_18645/m.44270 type:complete len:295 (-) Transcript_18645:175-1059(-)